MREREKHVQSHIAHTGFGARVYLLQMRAIVINNFGVRSCLVNIVECSVHAFAIKLHGLHPISYHTAQSSPPPKLNNINA
jgi:hypothetical protein